MTVRTMDRGPTDDRLIVQTEAYKLFVHSERLVMNPNMVEDQMFKIYGEPIISKAGQICEDIDSANAAFLFSKDSREIRNEFQLKALIGTRNLLTRIFILNERRKIPEKKLSYWVLLIEQLQKLIKAWIKSDNERIQKEGADI